MISNETAKHIFSGDGSSTQFPIPFDFFQNAAGVFDKNNQITVILTDSAGTETTLTEDTDYEVETLPPAGLGSSGYCGYVTLSTAPAVGEKLTVMRDVPLVQELDLEDGQQTSAPQLEAALDKIVMTLQQLNEKLQRAICYNPSTTDNQTDAAAYLATLYAAAQDAVSAKNAAVAAQGAAQTAQRGAETAANNASTAISTHNQSNSAHADIRTAIAGKQDALPSGTTGYYLKKTANGVEWAEGTGSGGSVTVDSALSDSSTNPVQNKAIYTALAAKQDTLSAAQLLAANSGITADKVSGYDTHVANGDIHVTSSQKSAWSGKQDAINGLSTTSTLSDSDTLVVNDATHSYRLSYAQFKNLAAQVFAKTDLSNSTIPHVVSFTQYSTKGFCREWSNGWCEQGDYSTNSSVTFHKEMADTNYHITITQYRNGADTSGDYRYVTSYSTTGLTQALDTNGSFFWRVEGYMATDD